LEFGTLSQTLNKTFRKANRRRASHQQSRSYHSVT
jgi:hypothetical protein